MVLFVDSSALVKRYLAETGSSWLEAEIAAASHVYLSRITLVEVVAALARRVRDPQALRLLLHDLHRHRSAYSLVEVSVPILQQA